MRYIAVLLCVVICGAACAENRLILQLDTGGHTAITRGIAFTPDGKQLVSAGEDKIIRVWDLESGEMVRSLRGESALGSPGKIYAMALSPNGKWLAVAGDFSNFTTASPTDNDRVQAIRLYEFQSGKLVALLKGHTDLVRSLSFSNDGSRLISGSSDATAIIWDTEVESGAQAPAPKLLRRLVGHKADIFTAVFSPDGKRAVTGSFDKELRLWQVSDGAEVALMAGHGDKVYRVAVAPDGTIASGDISGSILLWDGRDGHLLRSLAQMKTGVGSLSFSRDGKLLLASCGMGGCSGSLAHVLVYDAQSGRVTLEYAGHDNAVRASAVSPDGRWVATSASDNYDIHVWDPYSGKRRLDLDGQPLQLGGQGQLVWSAGFSADGRRIAWGNVDACPEKTDCPNKQLILQHALTLPLGGTPLGAPEALTDGASNFRHASPSFDDWSLAHRDSGKLGSATLDISKGGQVVASITRDTSNGVAHYAYSFSPDGEIVVSGGAYGLIAAYDREGKRLGEFAGHEGNVFAVAPSPDGRYLVSASGDETVRLWNLKTRELLVSLFQGKDGEWVMWTPQGFYASSPAGAELIGWQINHGPEREAEYVKASQLRVHLNRPDIIARAIQLASAEAAAKEAPGTDFTLADLLNKPVPKLRILSPQIGAAFMGGHANVQLELGATPDPVKLLRIQVNGVQIAEKLPAEGEAGFAPGSLAYDVPLAKGRNKIAIAATNQTGETVDIVSVIHEGEGELDRRGTLYILAIGVDDYPGLGSRCGDDSEQSCNLQFAGADAKAFADAMERRAGPLHLNTVKRVLTNGPGATASPTAANIRNELGSLADAKATDTVMLFVSGHGVNDGPNYRFAPTDAEWGKATILKPATAVPWFEFQEALMEAGGRRILFLDTCHSGNAFNPKLMSDSHEANIVVYSSTSWNQFAWEDPTLGGGHGLFTYALVEGVDGGARDEAGVVRAERLRDFLKSRVSAMAAKFTNAQQEPQYFRGRDAKDYVLARVKN